MTLPTQEKINDMIELLVRQGRIVPYRDDEGVMRFATAEIAAQRNLTGLALPVAEVHRELSAHEAELMGEWN